MNLKNCITRRELATLLNVQPATIARWTRQGRFPAPILTLGPKLIYYRVTDVQSFLDEAGAIR